MFLETCVVLGGPVCWHITVRSILLWFFVFLWFHLLFLLFHFLLCLSEFSLFSSRWEWSEACWFIFSEDQLLFYWSFLLFLDLYFIYFLSDFIISFVLLTLGFVCSFFPNYLGVRLGYLRFFLCLEEGLYGYELPFSHCSCYIPWVLGSCVFIFTCLEGLAGFLFGFIADPLFVQWLVVWFFPRFSYCGWFLVSHCCDQKRCLK